MRHAIDIAYRFLQGIIGKDWHEGAEDLFLHYGVAEGCVVDNGGFDLQSSRICLSAPDHFIRIDQIRDSVEMFPVDNLSIILAFQRLFAVLSLNLLFDLFDQFVFDGAVAVDVVGSDAGLTAVQIFAEDDSLCSQFQVRALLHDAGALSAKFQSDRG